MHIYFHYFLNPMQIFIMMIKGCNLPRVCWTVHHQNCNTLLKGQGASIFCSNYGTILCNSDSKHHSQGLKPCLLCCSVILGLSPNLGSKIAVDAGQEMSHSNVQRLKSNYFLHVPLTFLPYFYGAWGLANLPFLLYSFV